MKILLVYNSYRYLGGEDTYFNSLTSLLRKKGHIVIHYTKSSKDITSKVKTGINMFQNPDLQEELKSLIHKYRPDIAQVQNIYPLMNPSIYPFLSSMNIPIVQRISNYRYMCPKMSLFRDGKVCTDCVAKKLAYPSVIHACYNNSRLASLGFSLSHSFYKSLGAYDPISAYIFPSAFIQKYHVQNTNIPKEKMHVVPSFYYPAPISKVVNENEEFILFVGRLTPEKGIDLLLQAMKKLPKIKLIILGDGPLKEMVKAHEGENIIYKGQVSSQEVKAYIRQACFVVMPSKWYDVLPNVLIESFALQKPVVAPLFGVFPELITQKKNGLLYKYNDVSDLSRTVRRLFENKALNATLGENSYSTYKKNYTSEIHYKKILSLYSSLIK